ncbi:MAG TPA: hypothetical protein VEK76_12415 [Candidatus Binatia bacterium]|nr:hypothetical protein [Candidatus Binatia bacterium]
MSPTLLLGAVLALVGAQVSHLAAPRRLRYPVVLGLALLGVIGGEVVAQWLHAGGPALGSLHPVADVAGMVLLELGGAALHGPGRPRLTA